MLAVRDYLNEGGKLLVAGKYALQGAWDQFLFNPLGDPAEPFCKSQPDAGQGEGRPAGPAVNCLAVSNDFLQYWLGAYLPIGGGGRTRRRQRPCRSRRSARRSARWRSRSTARTRANNQDNVLLVPDDVELPAADEFPQFASDAAIKFDRPAAVRPADRHAVRVRSRPTRLQAADAGRST